MNTEVKIPDWKLERYLLKELPAEEMTYLAHQIAQDDVLRARLSDFEKSDAEIRAAYPPAWTQQQIRMKAESGSSSVALPRVRSRLWIWPAIPTVAMLILVAIYPDFIDRIVQDYGADTPGIRVKGIQPSLQIFRKTNSGPRRLTEGEFVHEHDLLQIAYLAAGHRFGMIFSIDGRGAFTQHLPYNGNQSASLDQNEAISLNFSYELDDAPDWERFYFITSEIPFEVDEVVQNIRRQMGQSSMPRTGLLNLNDTYHQITIMLRKDATDE